MNKTKLKYIVINLSILLFSCGIWEKKEVITNNYPCFSGIYPHLAYYNKEGECGTGAVVPWSGDLWVVTYSPHKPLGSSDKLYQITPDLREIIRPESIGGTPANRMIHRESNQLFIGPYAIDNKKNVRSIPYSNMKGRHTGNARHLFDPINKIYYGTMEEGFYEVDVHSLEPKELYKDGNDAQDGRIDHDDTDVNPQNATLPGAHGKGLYSGQGVLVYSNNGEASQEALEKFDIEAGILAEWNGTDWKLVRRNQFVEVTGPGGIYGNKNPEIDPIWTTGWDHKSIILGVRNPSTGWDFYRLPKASHSYDGAHGWNTEWPRIRNIGTPDQPDYLMTMHGMFWQFPGKFTATNASRIRPRSAYLKVIGDFARWNDRLVFGCDDSANREFLNRRKAKGNIEGPGQSNSNLWFTSVEQPDQLGPNTASGAVWLEEQIMPETPSEPFLFAGWPHRCVWINNSGEKSATFSFEIDKSGSGSWDFLEKVEVGPKRSANIIFSLEASGDWIRVKSNNETTATVHFSYTDEDVRNAEPDSIFNGLASVESADNLGGLLYGLGNDRRALGIASIHFKGTSGEETGYYELDKAMNLNRKSDPETEGFIREKFVIPEQVITIEESSILVIDDRGRRWRLPLGDDAYTKLINSAVLRIDREVATERDLFSCHGTFYELPAENADGFAKIRPIASHKFRIHDYASYRGMLIMTGIDPGSAKGNPHIILSDDGLAAVWAGVIDDLWKIGKPGGKGGPWKNSAIKANIPSDPYLIGFYDKKQLTLEHSLNENVRFTLEVEPIGHGPWMKYEELTVDPGEKMEFTFPEGFQARWIRLVADKDCKATAWFVYM